MIDTTSTIKPIETVYKGYRFRSRSEARWAVFLESLGKTYQYESEGYDLDGEWYLPDFWIPQWGAFLEVKNEPTNPLAGFYLCKKLTEQTGKHVLLVNGVPPHYSMIAWEQAGGYSPARFSQCRKCKAIYIEAPDGDYAYALERCEPSCPRSDKWPTPGRRVMDALEAAQQARFD